MEVRHPSPLRRAEPIDVFPCSVTEERLKRKQSPIKRSHVDGSEETDSVKVNSEEEASR